MKAFRQGNLDRFCSVYSVLNSMQLLGVHLSHNKAQAMYDYIIDQLNFYDSFFDTAENGADYKRLEQIMSFAKEYIKFFIICKFNCVILMKGVGSHEADCCGIGI